MGRKRWHEEGCGLLEL